MGMLRTVGLSLGLLLLASCSNSDSDKDASNRAAEAADASMADEREADDDSSSGGEDDDDSGSESGEATSGGKGGNDADDGGNAEGGSKGGTSTEDEDETSGGKPGETAGTPGGEDMTEEPVAVTCGSVTCAAEASCDEKDDKPVCVCPQGYDDVNGDGSACDDIDECADEALNDCADQATCKNSGGSYSCTCEAPAYVGDGKSCACAEGYEADATNPLLCLASNGTECVSNRDCAGQQCVEFICCASACETPGNCETAEGATCSNGVDCEYPLAEAGSVCTDGNACTDDACDEAGNCIGTEFDVTERCTEGSSCQAPSCDEVRGCIYANVSEGSSCDDGDACTVTDQCNSLGACIGTGIPSACDDGNECTTNGCVLADNEEGYSCVAEPKEGSCAAPDACATAGVCEAGVCQPQGNTCGAGDPTCLPGPPRVCQCAEPEYVLDSATGNCIPTDDECIAQNPCAAEATCDDPSVDPGNATCACPAGLVGDGRLDGTGCSACPDGMRAIKGQCVCDLSGTFASRVVSYMSWEDSFVFEAASGVESLSWSLRTHQYDDDGNLVVIERGCGGTAPEMCVPLFSQSMAGSIPFSTFDDGVIGAETHPAFAIPNARPGDPFKTPATTQLIGISLSPSQRDTYWPESWQTEGVNWVDADGDGILGVTTYWRGDGQPSPICPRGGGSAYTYGHVPAPVGLTIYRVAEVYGATRLTSTLDGTILDCNTLAGQVYGRNVGEPIRTDARVLGCKLANGDDCRMTDPRIIDFLDTEGSSTVQQIDGGEFVMRRLPAGMEATCPNVRSLDYSVP